MRRSLRRRSVKESFLVCVLWRATFGGQDLPLSIMTLVSQTCRQSISSALCRALTVLISAADMAHLTRYKTNFGSGKGFPLPVGSSGVIARQQRPQRAAESRHDDCEPNHEADGDSRDNATRIQHQKIVAACSGASAYTSVYLGIGQSQPQRGPNPHCAGQIVAEAEMITHTHFFGSNAHAQNKCARQRRLTGRSG
jgi:hypothetical protein